MRALRVISLIAAPVGLLVSLYIGLEKHLPWSEGGCLHGAWFDCAVVRQSAASTLLSVPIWVWGAAWFVALLGVLLLQGMGRRVPVIASVVVLGGWAWVAHLRGVELFILGKACVLCWAVGICSLLGGVSPLAEAWRRRLGLGLALAGALMIAGFFSALLRPPEPEVGEEIALPAIPGWQWVRAGESGLTLDALLRCGGQPTLVLVYDPQCEDCVALSQGLLQEEETQLFLSELCLTAVMFDEAIASPLADGLNRTPALFLLSAEGETLHSAAGEIDQEDLLELVTVGLEFAH